MNKQDIARLVNTLQLIETRGESTVIMAGCIQYLQSILNKPEETTES